MKYDYCATIGFFDGVHRGHQHVIGCLSSIARARGMKSMIITFDRHPRQVVHADYVPQLLSAPSEKLRLLRETGVDSVEVLHFDSDMARMPAREFMQTVLHDRLGVALLLTGYDNRFGHNRSEGFEDYVRYGKEMGMEVMECTPTDIDGLRVSSSLVRRLLADGDVAEAGRCLGRSYRFGGTVAHGYQEGRRLGFPTANICPDMAEQLIPLVGVYAARVAVEDGKPMPAMLNIGTNPTFQRSSLTIEAHIIGFDGDIYGKHVTVEFCSRLRGERRFDSIDALRSQLLADREAVIKELYSYPTQHQEYI